LILKVNWERMCHFVLSLNLNFIGCFSWRLSSHVSPIRSQNDHFILYLVAIRGPDRELPWSHLSSPYSGSSPRKWTTIDVLTNSAKTRPCIPEHKHGKRLLSSRRHFEFLAKWMPKYFCKILFQTEQNSNEHFFLHLFIQI
jgi:hypothetical protein